MVVFDGEYNWDGKKTDEREPVSWWPCSYHLKIIALTQGMENVLLMKPTLCLFSNLGTGYSVSANPDSLARRICDEFGLTMEKVMWVEVDPNFRDDFDVITFERRGGVGGIRFYSTHKRPPMEGEKTLIRENMAGF